MYFWQHAQDLHNVVKYRVIYMRQHEKIFNTMTKTLIVSLVCLFVFLTACWGSSSRGRGQIKSYLFATAWERSSA